MKPTTRDTRREAPGPQCTDPCPSRRTVGLAAGPAAARTAGRTCSLVEFIAALECLRTCPRRHTHEDGASGA